MRKQYPLLFQENKKQSLLGFNLLEAEVNVIDEPCLDYNCFMSWMEDYLGVIKMLIIAATYFKNLMLCTLVNAMPTFAI